MPANVIPMSERRRHHSLKLNKLVLPWLFVLPAIVFTFILRYYTLGHAFFMSLYDYNIGNPPGKFIGFKNYLFLLKQNDFRNAWSNTLIFTGLILLLTFFIPIIQAICLSEVIRGRGVFSSLYIIPAVFPLSVIVIIWKWIFHPSFGLANSLLNIFGLPSQGWYSDPNLVKLAIVIPGMIGGGFAVLLYLSAIMSIPKEIIEAASIDGCSGFRRLFYITLPNIKFLIMIQFILTVMGVMQFLDGPFQFSKGGPNQASTTVAYYSYTQFADRMSFGRSAAAAIMLLIVIAAITYMNMRLNKAERL